MSNADKQTSQLCLENTVCPSARSPYPLNPLSIPIVPIGGKLRGSMGRLQELPVSLVLGVCVPADGHHVHSWLRRCLCKDHVGTAVHGVLHPGRFGKTPSTTTGFS